MGQTNPLFDFVCLHHDQKQRSKKMETKINFIKTNQQHIVIITPKKSKSKNLITKIINIMKKIKSIFVILLSLSFLTSCKKTETETEMRSYGFTISRNNSVLANSSVSIATNGQNFSATTDNDGKCQINVPNSITLPQYTIVTIDHSSIKPYCLTVSGRINASSNLPINCTGIPSIVRLKEVTLHHLGNDIYSGASNSQFQLSTEGLERTFSYTLPATPGIMPRIQIYARGIENSANIFCNGIPTNSLGNSASNGDLSVYDFQLTGNANSIFHAGNNTITIKSGATGLSSDPWDDIEFCGMLLYY